jgi:PAS domain-containing protein
MTTPDAPSDAAIEASPPSLEQLMTQMELLGALRFDRVGRILSCNATMARLIGAPPEAVVASTLSDLLDAPDAAALLALVRGGGTHVASRVHVAFRGRARRTFDLECAVALDGGGGALLGGRPRLDFDAAAFAARAASGGRR